MFNKLKTAEKTLREKEKLLAQAYDDHFMAVEHVKMLKRKADNKPKPKPTYGVEVTTIDIDESIVAVHLHKQHVGCSKLEGRELGRAAVLIEEILFKHFHGKEINNG